MTNNEKCRKIVKAIDEADLLFIEGELCRPEEFDGVMLFYRDLLKGEKWVADVNDIKSILTYEEGA